MSQKHIQSAQTVRPVSDDKQRAQLTFLEILTFRFRAAQEDSVGRVSILVIKDNKS